MNLLMLTITSVDSAVLGETRSNARTAVTRYMVDYTD